MELPPALRLSFENNPSAQDRRAVEEALGAYNAPFLRNPPYSYFGIFIRDEVNAIRAGLIGNCYAGWLFIALLWVHADLRRIGIGSRLMAEAERHGRDFGCHSALSIPSHSRGRSSTRSSAIANTPGSIIRQTTIGSSSARTSTSMLSRVACRKSDARESSQ